MTKIKIKTLSRQIFYGLITLALVVAYFPSAASAQAITTRKVVLGSSAASANTTYNFTFTVSQATTIKSVKFQACDTPSGACTTTGSANGFSSAVPGSTLAAPTNIGSGGAWVVDNSTPTELRMNNNTNTGAPSAGITANFSNVHNPSAVNSTFFIRITTYSDSTYTTSIDSGTVATSTAGQITVTAAVDETLTFTLASATVALGTLTTASTGTGTSTMTVATNASTGYSVGYVGNTLTSGSNTITAMAGAGSSQNSKQFGINLVANTTPAIGSDKTGSVTGVVSAGYGTANSFKFVPAGEAVATAASPTNNTVFTTSYIANIDGATAAGAYSTVITYTATANF